MQSTFEIKVFVSCPGDVTSEKEMIKDVCNTQNDILMSVQSPFRFKVLDFRDIIATMSGRAQEEINKRFSDYDIYIGLMWMRFGTPSGATDPTTGNEYQSGTEEEFRIAHRMYEVEGKANIYMFFKRPGATKNLAETQQLVQVQEFEKELQHLGWVNSIENESRSVPFNNKLHKIFSEWVRTLENKNFKAEKQKYLNKQSQFTFAFIEFDKFITKSTTLHNAIPRTLSPFSIHKASAFNLYETSEDKSLIELVKEKKHMVLLGTAGSGKSTELGNLAHFYAKKDTPFIPIYQRLNTYVDEPIEDFLPSGWKDVPEAVCLVILDGLDEVQPVNFNTAVRKIQSFSEKFTDLRIVVSCRTNFYDFPDATSGGTLAGFEVYFINEIRGDNISDYATNQFKVNYAAFIKEIQNENMDQLTVQPFFLNILLAEFKKSGHLRVDKVKLLETYIAQRIVLDQTHYKLTIPLKEKQPYIIELLKTIALTMEYLGRNFLQYDELLQLLPNVGDVELIKYSTAFKNFESDTEKWGFEHNNIQEFLAASKLRDLSTEAIKYFISFHGKIIKPSWLNTVFFLMSILKEDKRQELISWILQIDPEVLVKIEPDKVNAEVRLQIFRRIFESYKFQDVWLRSNKFSSRELARFVPTITGNTYLLEQLRLEENSRVVKLNAVEILKSQRLGVEQSAITRDELIKFIKKNVDDQYIFHSVTSALSSLNLLDKNIIDDLLEIFGQTKNQYIRTGFYKMIINVDLVDEYINYILEGVSLRENEQDRDEVHLLDEHFYLKEALTGELNYNSVIKCLVLFEEPHYETLINFHEKNEILKNVIEKAITFYGNHKGLYDLVKKMFLKCATTYSEKTSLDIITDFFRRTGTDLAMFKDCFYDRTMTEYDKSLLYQNLLSVSSVDYLINEYNQRNLTNKNLLDFYNNVKWSINGSKDTELAHLIAQLKEHSTVLNDYVEIDYAKVHLANTKQNIELYFSPAKFKDIVVGFFAGLTINEIDWDALWTYKKSELWPETKLPDAVFDMLVSFTRKNPPVQLDSLLEFMNDTRRFKNYLFSKLKDKLKDNQENALNQDQQQALSEWVQENLKSADIVNAIHRSSQNPSSISVDKKVGVLWYYISRFSIKGPEVKLLDFTLFEDPAHHSGINSNFKVLEEMVGIEKVKARVSENLKHKIIYDPVWVNNAIYAIENSIHSTYPFILTNTLDTDKSFYSRKDVLKKYMSATSDLKGVEELLNRVGRDEIRWTIVDLLSDELIDVLKSYLLELMNDIQESLQERIKSAQYLTKLGETQGTKFFLKHLLEIRNSSLDSHYDYGYLRMIKDTTFIPSLINLLELANTPQMLADKFNRLESYISDALFNIGLVSETNLLAVRDALEQFIKANKEKIQNVNFYYPMIDRMIYHYYLIKSQNVTLDDAISEISKLKQ